MVQSNGPDVAQIISNSMSYSFAQKHCFDSVNVLFVWLEKVQASQALVDQVGSS